MQITHLFLDVDGTLTDGGVYYDEDHNEIKKFNTKDGLAINVARAAGINIIVLTGRESGATQRRMTELGVHYIFQNVRNKATWLKDYILENNLDESELGYIGDDVNDLWAMRLCGWVGCPKDAASEILQIANFVSPESGGHGAVRDCIQMLLGESWSILIERLWRF